MKVTCIYWPRMQEKLLFKRAVRVTMGKTECPQSLPSSYLIHDCLRARHSPIRTLQFAFLIENIPADIAEKLGLQPKGEA